MLNEIIQTPNYSLVPLPDGQQNNYALHVDGHSITIGFERVQNAQNGYYLLSGNDCVGFVRDRCNVPDEIMDALAEIRHTIE